MNFVKFNYTYTKLIKLMKFVCNDVQYKNYPSFSRYIINKNILYV